MCCDRYPGQNLLYGMRKGRRHAWATGLFAISQRTWRSFGKIALDPAIDRAALHARMLGDDGNRLAFCNLGNRRPKAPVKAGVVRLRKRSQKVSTIRPTERRIARSGCVSIQIPAAQDVRVAGLPATYLVGHLGWNMPFMMAAL